MAIAAGAMTVAAAAAVLALTSSSSYHGEDATMAEAVVPAAAAARECAVCLSELPAAGADEDDRSGQEPPAVRALPACGHAFHADCIGRWLPVRPECPLCRCPVPPLAVADGQQVAAPAATPWARPARGMACGFGDGRVVWTRSPSDRQ